MIFSSFFIAIIGYALLAVVAILDKLILSKALNTSSYTFYSNLLFGFAFVMLPFAERISLEGFLWSLASGLGFGFAAWAMFIALEKNDATHIIPFIGAMTAVCTYALSAVVLGESLTLIQTLGIVLLVVASFLFAYERDRVRVTGISMGVVWGIVSGLLFAISHVTAKVVYEQYSFVTGFAWTKGLVVLVALCVYLFGKKMGPAKTKQVPHAAPRGQHNNFILIAVDKIAALLGIVAVQYAMSIGSVTIVTGLVGLQYALILIYALIFTTFTPRFFTEYITRKEILFEGTAILLVIGGAVLLA